jgi:hypothetical protein
MNTALTFDDVLLIPNYNHWDSRRLVDISSTDKTGQFSLTFPVLSSNMDTITGTEMAKFMHSKGGIGVLHRFMDIATNVKDFRSCQCPVFVSVGCSENEYERIEALRDAGAEYFCVDVAHAHSKILGKALKRFRHILPNVLGPVIVIAASNFATAIIVEAGLSFLGIGIQPPQPSWGLMIKENYNFIITHNPMIALMPGFAIMLLVLAFNLLGNGLRDAFDSRSVSEV